MKKKKFAITKIKKKFERDSMLSKARIECKNRFNTGEAFLTFFKKFKLLNIFNAERVCVLLGVRASARFNTIRGINVIRFRRIIRLKFYFNYIYMKEWKLDLLKTLVTFKMIRYFFSLPMRGQRTRTHAKTRKKYHIT